MHEDFLQFIWANGLFNALNLRTTDGRQVQVVTRGNLNHFSGPDFSLARIRIGDELLIGDVEIHIHSTLWNDHRHQFDPAYNSVILHVVYEHNVEVKRADGHKVPTLELQGRIHAKYLNNYEKLISSRARVACASSLESIPKLTRHQTIDRMLVDRLHRKSEWIAKESEENQGDWLHAFYVALVSYIGHDQNKLPFQALAKKLPIQVLLKYADDRNALEALLYGAAGMIPDKSAHEYVRQLQADFKFLKTKHALSPQVLHWKFGHIRPDAFPTRRILLITYLVSVLQDWVSALIHREESTIPYRKVSIPHAFWDSHYTFYKTIGSKKPVQFSRQLFDSMMINAVAPFLVFYGHKTGDQKRVDQAMHLLTHIEAERNKITRMWDDLGWPADHAADSQGLIELYKCHCQHKNCVLCTIGRTAIST